MIHARQGEPDWEALTKVVTQWKPNAFVIGIPYNMDGTGGPMTEKVSAFARKLETLFSLPCHGVDERLSTREAKDISRANAEASGRKYNDRAEVDSLAAQLILESWLSENS